MKNRNITKQQADSAERNAVYDVVVHVGAPKTGSSALQYFFSSNAGLLESYGYYYPPHEVDSNGISCGHSGLGIHFINGDLSQAKKVFNVHIKQAKEKNLTLLLSSESFCPYAEHFSSIAGNYKVRVIGFIRDPLEAIVSSYNQLVKRHFYAETLDTYCQGILKSYASQFSGEELDRWKQKFGSDNVSIYHYDDVNANDTANRIERFFLPILGVPEKAQSNFSFPGKAINRSYTDSALELKRLLNVVLDKSNTEMNNKIDTCLQSYSDNHPSQRPEINSLLDLETISSLKKKFELAKRAPNTETQNFGSAVQKQTSANIKQSKLAGNSQFGSPTFVAENAFRTTPDVRAYIKNCLCGSVKPGNVNQNLIKLINIFGLQGCAFEPAGESKFFIKSQLKTLLDADQSKFDILYQIAVTFERAKDYSSAYWVISELLTLRPTGPVLLKASNRLKKHLDIAQ